jgi:predicted nucleotidyltransferase
MVAMVGSDTAALRAISEVCRRHPGLHLAVVFGSRARGDFTTASDVDIAYLADKRLDRDSVLADLVRTLDIERVDLVDLDRAGGLVRFRVARDGIVVFEARPDAFTRFWFEAVDFWCDAGPVIRAGYDDVLAELSR